MKDDKLYLIHIRECIDRIKRYTAAGQAVFLADTLTQDGVLRNLHTMAESTQRLSDELKAAHATIAWAAIAAFRNVIVHNYLGLDLDRIWQIVTRDLPPLDQAVTLMLQELDDN